jgi:hypothetical protein
MVRKAKFDQSLARNSVSAALSSANSPLMSQASACAYEVFHPVYRKVVVQEISIPRNLVLVAAEVGVMNLRLGSVGTLDLIPRGRGGYAEQPATDFEVPGRARLFGRQGVSAKFAQGADDLGPQPRAGEHGYEEDQE